MLAVMKEMGLDVEKHHHEVAAASTRLGLKFDTLTNIADNLQLYKYVVHNVAHAYGKTATFMPKPVYGDNGTGMHCHQSIWKDGKPLFAGDKYGDLSQECLYYIGIIKHARAINAMTNPSTNSYKRLIPGFKHQFCWPILPATARPHAVFPFATSAPGKRIEILSPTRRRTLPPYRHDDGRSGPSRTKSIRRPNGQRPLRVTTGRLKDVPQVCGSLREAVEALDADRDFLKKVVDGR
ncbi:MAG: hypothetical protein CM15mP21_2580 [Hyphomicrobiales bacterium]|nr:MAG: hypothetical protein CM15mP21_2580 [Hyphomicrobiales bacterium]